MDARVNASRTYAFGAFRLDAARLVLSYDGKLVPTTHRVLSTLLYLVENQGRTLSKMEMLEALWPGRTVEEANLSQAISNLRKILSAYGHGDLVTTVAGRGYRFVGEVVQEPVGGGGASEADSVAGLDDPSKSPPTFRPVLVGLAAALAGVAILGAAGLWRLQSAPHKLVGERTGIVLADPQDFTGETDLDHVVTQVVRADLSQSPMFQVASDAQVAETLALMEQPQGALLTLSKARDVCARTGGGAVVSPTISKVQQRYVLTLTAVSCVDGRVLVDEKVEADDRAALVSRLSGLTKSLRRQLGEARPSIARFDVPLAPERTSSFDALRAFSEAQALMREGRRLEAIPLYEHATELDPDFAMAYFGLSQAYYEFSQAAEDAAAITKAFARVALVSERDALLIREHYYGAVTHDLDAARDNVELLTRLYPKDSTAWLDLCELRYRVADYAGAKAACEMGLKLDPHNSGAYTSLARALNHLQQTAKAEQLDQEALKVVPETDQIRQQRIAWRFMQGDPAGAQKLVDSAVGTPIEREALLEASNFAFASGRVADAVKLVARADAQGRLKDLPPNFERQAESYMEVGLDAKARTALAQLPASAWCGYDDYLAARLEAPAKAEAVLRRDLAQHPHDTLLNGEYAPEAHAALLLRQNRPLEAARTLEAVGRLMFHDLDAPYLRGTALLAAHDPKGAATVFRSILQQTGFSWNPQYALSHLGLARALGRLGETAASLAEYRRFLTVWKDADEDLPALRQARAEAAALAATSSSVTRGL